ncbi:MAG: histidinol dehydrogenase [Treponema sp.]|nr:histidinol dehydrogenase [Treponema sp.]
MKIINSGEFNAYWKNVSKQADEDFETEKTVKEIICAVQKEGDAAVRRYASKFDKASPQKLEVPFSEAQNAFKELRANEPELAAALELSGRHIKRFSEKQKEQFTDFEYEMEEGLFTGQKVIPVQRAAVYIPAGRFPLFSTVLMCMIPAFCAGAEEVFLASPPLKNGIPDKKIMAAAALAAEISCAENKKPRIFSMGGAQAVAALALGTESVPRADIIAGPGNRFVAAAKRILFGKTGIDFIAGPSDVLIISDVKLQHGKGADNNEKRAADIIAADMLAQAEHDPDARARALVADNNFAALVSDAVNRLLKNLEAEETARASLDAGGLIIVYRTKEEAAEIANIIAPEHLQLQAENDIESWIPLLKNYGSLFIGLLSAEVLGDYSAGINHTLPTETSSRFTGGLSVRNFLKTVTTLRCLPGTGFESARNAAEIIGKAEGLEAHAKAAQARR